jgi:hypothetical protein
MKTYFPVLMMHVHLFARACAIPLFTGWVRA